MLNEKQFRDRAVRELREIGKQVSSLATDRDLYQKLEADVIRPIPGSPRAAAPTSQWCVAPTPMPPPCACGACSRPTPLCRCAVCWPRFPTTRRCCTTSSPPKSCPRTSPNWTAWASISRNKSIRISPITSGPRRPWRRRIANWTGPSIYSSIASRGTTGSCRTLTSTSRSATVKTHWPYFAFPGSKPK